MNPVVLSVYSQRLCRVVGLFFLSVAILGFLRLATLIWNWPEFSYEEPRRLFLAFIVGARFDVVASAWLTIPLLAVSVIPWPARWDAAWRAGILALYLILQIPFLVLNVIDIEFMNFVGQRMTPDVLFLLGEAQGKISGFLNAFGPLFMLALAFLTALVAGSFAIVCWIPKRPRRIWSGWYARAALVLLLCTITVVASRGGTQRKPISFVDANVFAEPSRNSLVFSTTFNVLKRLGQEQLSLVRYFDTDDEMGKWLNGSIRNRSLLEGQRSSRPQNVVVLIMESFGREYMGESKGERTWTPFLDSLASRSLFFGNGFANGRRSIDAIAAVMAGVPALMDQPFVGSPFAANRFVGLGSALKTKDYTSAFFHGGPNGTMHFDSFAKQVGIEAYYGVNEYPNPDDHDGAWGIYDGPFLMWTLSKISEMRPPFFASWFSLSSHLPYLIPPAEADRYADGPLPILKAITYADDVLKRFFAAAENEPWYRDTLFVITADHTFKPIDPAKDNLLWRYRVPILFFHPSFAWPNSIDREQITQQIDILPSILDFLGIKRGEQIALGRSVFVPGERTATLQLNGEHLLVAKDFFLHWPGVGASWMYAFSDAARSNPLNEPVARKQELENRLKASIQYFRQGMLKNRLHLADPGAKAKHD